MHSVRMRISLIAALATAVAVSLIAIFLLSRVEQSLRDEIDLSLTNQVVSYRDAIFTIDDIEFARWPDPETLFVAFDATGAIYDTNVDLADGQVIGALVLDGRSFRNPVVVDLSFPETVDIEGSDAMRAASRAHLARRLRRADLRAVRKGYG